MKELKALSLSIHHKVCLSFLESDFINISICSNEKV